MEEYIEMVKLATLEGKVSQTVRETQVVVSRRLIDKLHRVAKGRDCSVNPLVNPAREVSRFARKQPGVAAVGGSVSCR